MSGVEPVQNRTLAIAFLAVYALIALGLLVSGSEVYEHLHLELDTANGILSLLLAVFLLAEQSRMPVTVRNILAISFAFAAFTEILHALVGVEWSGSMGWISDAAHNLRPATWPPSAYILPLGLGWVWLIIERNWTIRPMAFVGGLALLTFVTFVLSFHLPKYVDTGLLGIQRPTQIPLLFLLAGLVVAYWQKRELHPLYEGIAWMCGLLFLSDLAMLFSTSPHEKFTMVAHSGKLLAYAFLHTIQMRLAAADSRARQASELALANSEIHMRTLIDTLPDLIWLKDPNGVYINCNRRFELLYGTSEAAIVGKTDYDFVDRELADSFRRHDLMAMERNSLSVNEEEVSFSSDGHRELLETTKVPMHDAQGQLIGVLGIGHDITKRKQLENQARQLAFYDALTKLPNRRLMNDRLNQSLALSKRSNCFGALLFIDLDNFKPLNDAHGHAVGDMLLVEVARRLKSCVREMDTVARIGGDEFVAILTELNLNNAAAIQQAGLVGEKILAALSAPYLLEVAIYEQRTETVEHHCTASIGVTLFRYPENSQIEIVTRADAAMYQAKESGRNSIRFYSADS